MTREPFTLTRGDGPLVALALHHGHEVRPEVRAALAVDEATRLREEDPYTGIWTDLAPTRAVAHRSRFEVDLNRPRSGAVYAGPEEAWGIDVWEEGPPDEIVRRSLEIWDAFYDALEAVLEKKADTYGYGVVYDLHSYNHRRGGPGSPADDPGANPEINLGTGNLDRDRWAPVVDAFLGAAARPRYGRAGLDVRENVRFQGGYLSRWISERWPARICVLAVEVKKTFMDEWSGRVDLEELRLMGARLAATTSPVLEAARSVAARQGTPS